ncbi:MAG: carbon storage regulator [Xanthomonadales bacterium]|jgi:sRNA-binding carbon storage regulator CsrA|nr:carbon storage regulator [Xanthomonadales bacterium]
MLVLSRKIRQSLVIDINDPDIANKTVAEVFGSDPIVIALLSSGHSFARVGIKAPNGVRILRAELYEEEQAAQAHS